MDSTLQSLEDEVQNITGKRKWISGFKKKRNKRNKKNTESAGTSKGNTNTPISNQMVGPLAIPSCSNYRPEGKQSLAVDSTPPDMAPNTKRSQDNSSVTRQAAAIDINLQVAIVCEDEVAFTNEHRIDFLDAIGDAVLEIPDDIFTPRFSSTQNKGQYLMVSAVDEDSMNWIMNAVPALKLWGKKLKAISAKDIACLNKAMVWLPGKKPTSDLALRTLNKQNQGLNSIKWKIYKTKQEPLGLRLVVGMDDSSVKYLKGCNFRPYYKSDIGKITLLTKKPIVNQGDNAGSSEGSATIPTIMETIVEKMLSETPETTRESSRQVEGDTKEQESMDTCPRVSEA